MSESNPAAADTSRYKALIEVARNRLTSRQFAPVQTIPREHYEMILEAARHAPSGASPGGSASTTCSISSSASSASASKSNNLVSGSI